MAGDLILVSKLVPILAVLREQMLLGVAMLKQQRCPHLPPHACVRTSFSKSALPKSKPNDVWQTDVFSKTRRFTA